MAYRLYWILMIIVVGLSGCMEKPQQAAQAPPPPEIPVIIAEGEEVPLHLDFVGQVYGAKDSPIRARVQGFLEGIHFEEGSTVKEGTLLYTVESQPYEADVAAQMSRVAEAKINLAHAANDLKRIRPLAERNAVSQSDLDAAVAAHDAAKASVNAAQANLRAARIQLSYTKIHSPTTGIIGKTRAKVGEFVGQNPNPVILNVVSDISTVLVQFYVTENQYIRAVRHQAKQQAEAPGSERFSERTLELFLSDGSRYAHMGKFDFIDRGIDPTTGAILVQTSFPNPEELLRPGMFARVRLLAEVLDDGILVPQRCVTELQGQSRVFVVGADNTVSERKVTLGPTIGSSWLILEGLKPGEKVVYEGLQRIADGAPVKPVVTQPTEPGSDG
jgi:membrane fusion protein (multidrug efflux system)